MPKINLLDVTLKNFCSFGNNDTTFEYQSGINVVTGHAANSTRRNGIGKSTLLVDAASFAIYGKPLRGGKVKLDDLVNNVNKKGCEVTLRLQVDSDILKISRKLKPGSLEVFVNDSETPKKFDSKAHTQEWLEDKIGISHTCFSNILVLNINSSTPFLEMDKAKKREVMEDILTLGVYGKMAEQAKTRHLNAKDNMKDYEGDFKSAVSAYNLAKESREGLDERREKFEQEKQKHIAELEKEINDLRVEDESIRKKTRWGDYSKKIEQFHKFVMVGINRIAELNSEITDHKKQIKEANDVLKKLDGEPHCPLCSSSLDSKNTIALKYIEDCRKKVNENETQLKEKENEYEKQLEEKSKNERNESKAKKIIADQEQANRRLDVIASLIDSHTKQLDEAMHRTFESNGVISDDRLNELNEEVKRTEEEYENAEKEFNYFKVIRKLLGEEGMRKFVVSKILPYLNTKVNEYLKIMGSEFTLIFDANLEETISTKTRDTRGYPSLSAGERKRVDVAVLLALMDVSKMQNSVDTNILVLDEVLDTSMDNEGVESFLEYLKNQFKTKYPEKCIYIITHRKEIADDNFDRLINLINKNGFTYIDSIIDF